MHGLNSPSRESQATSSSTLVDSSSLIPSHSAPQQLFRTWLNSSSQSASFAHLPRIILQLVNGYLSLKEIGAWCATSKDIYSTAAYFRCPVNTVQGGWRLRWLVIGKEFSWPRVRMLAYAAPRIQVTIVEATDPHGGLLTSNDQLELIRALPYLTELHAHYRFDRPLDWAEQITTLVTRSDAHAAIAAYQPTETPSSIVSATASVEAASAAVRPIPLLRTTSTAPAPLPAFRSLMLCPHDALVDGGEIEEDENVDLFQPPSASNSSSASATSASSPKKKPAKKKASADEMKAEHDKAVAEDQVHFDKWSIYNEKLFSKLHLFTTLEILGLNLTGNCSKWDVSGFKMLSNLHTIELDIETPQNFIFARHLTEIIEYVRDVPYRNLRKFQSNGLHYKHLQQLLRKRLPTDPTQEDPPCWQTLCHFRTYGDEPPSDVRAEADQWMAEQNEKYVLPFYGKKKAQPTEEEEKKAAASSSSAAATPSNPGPSSSSSIAAASSSSDDNLDLNCDEILHLYAQLPKLRTLDLLGFRSPLSDDGYLTLPSFADVDTLSVGGVHPELLSLMDGGSLASENCMPVMKQNFIDCMRKIASKPVHVERLTFAYMRLTPQPTENEDGSPVWTASEASPTPLHDALFPFSAFLIELELHCIQGMTDVSAVALCSKLESLRLVAAGGIEPKSITQLTVLKLRSLRLSNIFLPDDLVKQLQVPSSLMPSLVDFVCDTPHLDMNGDDEFAGLLNIPPEQLQQALGGLPPQMQWLGDWLQTQIAQVQQQNNHAQNAAEAQPAPAAAAAAPAADAGQNPLQFGALYQQLYNSLFQGNGNEDMPQLGEDEDDYYIPEDEDDEGHGDYEDTVD